MGMLSKCNHGGRCRHDTDWSDSDIGCPYDGTGPLDERRDERRSGLERPGYYNCNDHFDRWGIAIGTIAAREAKLRFGELLDTAQREPVTIEKHGRAVAVVVSAEEYKELEALKLANLRAEIDKGLEDIAAGRTVDGEEAFKALRERLA